MLFRWPNRREWLKNGHWTEYRGLRPGPMDVVLVVTSGAPVDGRDPDGVAGPRTIVRRVGLAEGKTEAIEIRAD